MPKIKIKIKKAHLNISTATEEDYSPLVFLGIGKAGLFATRVPKLTTATLVREIRITKFLCSQVIKDYQIISGTKTVVSPSKKIFFLPKMFL